MCQLLETIRLENGKMMNIPYHENRIDRSLKKFYGKRELPLIRNLIQISGSQDSGVFKCSMVYSNTDFKISIQPYRKRNITSLLLIEKPDLHYDFKYADRSLFDNFLPQGNINSEIIFTRRGILTDTRYTNIALEKDGLWITPQTPLLEGTQRAFLIDNKLIQTGEISHNEINDFSRIRLFNAMIPWEDCIELDIANIKTYD
jgi:4-amino-4-deoxychorismate lyase